MQILVIDTQADWSSDDKVQSIAITSDLKRAIIENLRENLTGKRVDVIIHLTDISIEGPRHYIEFAEQYLVDLDQVSYEELVKNAEAAENLGHSKDGRLTHPLDTIETQLAAKFTRAVADAAYWLSHIPTKK